MAVADSELNILLGPQGLYPVSETMRLVANSKDFSSFPTHFWWDLKSQSLWFGVGIGILTSAMAVANRFARPALAVSVSFI